MRPHDPALLEAIDRAEVAAYFRDAEEFASPAVRMASLTAAAWVAHERGLGDLDRDAATKMQNIDPASLSWLTFTASNARAGTPY